MEASQRCALASVLLEISIIGMSERHAIPRPGQILAGSYRVDRTCAISSMGVVIAAHHRRTGHRVAIKLLRPARQKSRRAIARFVREAKVLSILTSDYSVRIWDVGMLANRTPYLVMEWLEGSDLKKLLHTHGILSVQRAAGYVMQAAVALAEAHRLGIVHRDLKPSNLFCTERGNAPPVVKVIDFGVCKGPSSSTGFSRELTEVRSVLGSPRFMSPEQLHNPRQVDHRSDIWSLGVVLFQLMTGRTPFEAATIWETASRIVNTATPSLREYRPEIPPRVQQVVHQCLQKNPHDRFQTISNLATALAPFAPVEAQNCLPIISRLEREKPPRHGFAICDGESQEAVCG